MRRDVAAQRVLAAAVHELAQPCASATLAVDTALELTARHGLADLAQRLESASASLAQVLERLRLLSLVATAAAVETEAVDIAVLMAATLPGAKVEAAGLVRLNPDVAKAAVQEIARAIDAVPEDTRIGRSENGDAVEIFLSGASVKTNRLDAWRRLFAPAGIGVSLRRSGDRTVVCIRLPMVSPIR